MNQEVTILDDLAPQNNLSRKQLIPLWIKVFIWIFMVLGAIVAVLFIFSLGGAEGNLSLYGLETTQPLSPVGVVLLGLFLFKGLAAFGLWTEKDWAITVAKTDAIIGIAVCAFIGFILPLIESGYEFRLPLELALLIPYLIKLNKMQPLWGTARQER